MNKVIDKWYNTGISLKREMYEDMMSELNTYDRSVGIEPISLGEEEIIIEILTDFKCKPLGYYETSEGEIYYKFTCGNNLYGIKEDIEYEMLIVYEVKE